MARRNEFLHHKSLIQDIAEIIYASGGKQGYGNARTILKLVNIAALDIFGHQKITRKKSKSDEQSDK